MTVVIANYSKSEIAGKNKVEVEVNITTNIKFSIILISFSFFSFFFQVNTKFLAPLFLAYDDRLKEKEQMIRTYDVSLRFVMKLQLLAQNAPGWHILVSRP